MTAPIFPSVHMPTRLGFAVVDLQQIAAALDSDAAHGCPEGTTCPTCGPVRAAIRELQLAFESELSADKARKRGVAR